MPCSLVFIADFDFKMFLGNGGVGQGTEICVILTEMLLKSKQNADGRPLAKTVLPV